MNQLNHQFKHHSYEFQFELYGTVIFLTRYTEQNRKLSFAPAVLAPTIAKYELQFRLLTDKGGLSTFQTSPFPLTRVVKLSR